MLLPSLVRDFFFLLHLMWLQDCIDQYESHFPFHYGLELSFNELLRVDQAEVGMILFFLWMSPTPWVEPSCNHSRGVLYSQLIWRISHLIFSVHPLQLNNDCDVVQRFSRHEGPYTATCMAVSSIKCRWCTHSLKSLPVLTNDELSCFPETVVQPLA